MEDERERGGAVMGFQECKNCSQIINGGPGLHNLGPCKNGMSHYFEPLSFPKLVQERVRMATTQKDYLSKFKSILDSMYDTTVKKNGDYADEKDAFSNFRIVEEMTAGKISTEMGIFTRMSDKFKRIASLLGRPGLVLDEKIEDTLLDLAVYCIIMLLYLREKASNES